MKKLHKHTDLSNRQCSVKGCHKFLKQRIVEQVPGAHLCYVHHMELERRNPRFKDGKKLPSRKKEAPEVNHGQ